MNIEALYEMCEYLEKDLEAMNEKVRAAGSSINSDTLTYIDKLTHAIKSVKSTILMEEPGHSERGYSRDAYNRGGMSYDGSYNSYDGSYDSSYARGRGSNAKRDSMGRYSSERGYSRGYSGHNEELMQRINDLMNRTTEPQFKSELQRIQRDIEQM